MDVMTDAEIANAIKMRVLDKIPFSYGISFDSSWLSTITANQYIDGVADRLAVEINFDLPGTQETGEVNWPLTWWDAFKIEFFPQWLLDKFPPEYETFSYVRTIHVYPLEKFGRRITK